MKIFALYAKFDLTSGPPWLDEFRKKYDEPWDLHITLKQPCFIPDEGVEKLRSRVKSFFSELQIPSHLIPINFKEIFTHKGEHGMTIMVRAKPAKLLSALQKDLVRALADYTDYVDPDSRAYEENFDPHITIGRRLSPEHHREASTYLADGYVCEGIIKKVVLSVVKDETLEEGLDPANKTAYDL